MEENPEFILDDARFSTTLQSELLRLVRRKPTGWEWQVHLRITEMLGKLLMARELLTSPHAELPAPVVRVLNAISANPLRDWKAKELAVIGKVSYSGLRAAFQKSGQGTVHEHIQRANTFDDGNSALDRRGCCSRTNGFRSRMFPAS